VTKAVTKRIKRNDFIFKRLKELITILQKINDLKLTIFQQMKLISRLIFFYILGWKIENDFPKDLKKYLIIAAPHTSSMDFPIGIMTKFILGVDIKFIGKHTLFKPPFGFIFRALGGTPVDRSKSTNMVQALIDIFNEKEDFIFALSPEGTRKRTVKWKTGFYHVAIGADVPIVMAAIDFGNKKVTIEKPYYLSKDQETDFKYFHRFFKDIKGKNPNQFEPNFNRNL